MQSNTRSKFSLLVSGLYGLALSCPVLAQENPIDAPQYEDGNALVLPQDYRLWPFIGAGLGLTYEDEGGVPPADESPIFSHVFVNPTAYAHFMETGQWPDRTVFVLEFRESASEVSININESGFFATDLALLEAEVKDSRFDDGWAYFGFGNSTSGFLDVAEPLSAEDAAPCVQCHTDHGAVERTFVQFYPTLFEVAREKGTVKPTY